LYDVFKFLRDNANFALFIATFLLVIVTFLYVLYTKKMAKMMVKQADETKRMADIMFREYELKKSPSFIEIEPREPSEGQVILKLSNRGDNPVTVETVNLEWWFREKPDKTWVLKNRNNTMKGKNLSKYRPIDIPFIYDIEGLRKEEYPKSKEMSKEELRSSVTGRFCFYYLDFEGSRQEKIAEIISLFHL